MQSGDPHCFERTTNDDCCSTVLCENETEIIDLGNETLLFRYFFLFFCVNTGSKKLWETIFEIKKLI